MRVRMLAGLARGPSRFSHSVAARQAGGPTMTIATTGLRKAREMRANWLVPTECSLPTGSFKLLVWTP